MKRNILLCLLIIAASIYDARSFQTRQDASEQELAAPVDEAKSFIVQHADVPLYPAIARTARLSGTVVVRVTIKDGSVSDAQPQSSANSILVKAAMENVRTWKFTPDINGTLHVTYVYEIDKKESDFPRNPHIEMQLPNLVKITATPTKPTTNYGEAQQR